MLVGFVILLICAIPPLTPDQRDQLATATDDSPRLEEPALHALLTNVRQWEVGDESGARVPDYDALLADPAAGRGESFLIEGQFAGRARHYRLAGADPRLGDALAEWVILVRSDPQEVAVVYFVDPGGEIEAPRTGADVRVVGRFYKVWSDTDRDGRPTRYLTFVARSAKVAGGRAATPRGPMLPIVLLVAVLGGVYLLIRIKIRRHSRTHDRHVMLSGPGVAQPVDDPAEALQKLAEHKDGS